MKREVVSRKRFMPCVYPWVIAAISVGIVLPEASGQTRLISGQDGADEQTSTDPEIFSGPQVDEPLPPLPLQLVLSDDPAQIVDAIKPSAERPHALIVFVHQITRPSMAFTRILGNYAATRADSGLSTSVVFLGQDTTAVADAVRRAKHALPEKVQVGVSPDGLEGPGAYGLNRNLTLTILIASEGKVRANHALVDPSLPVDLPKVLSSLVRVVGGPEPEIRKLLAEGIENNQPENPPGFDRVEPLLRKLIRKETSDEDVDRLAAEIDGHLTNFPLAKARLKEIAGRVHNIYGSPRAQVHLRRWAEVEP